MELNQLKGALEAVLFAHGEPVSTARLADVFEMDEAELSRVLAVMRDEYQAAGRVKIILIHILRYFYFI